MPLSPKVRCGNDTGVFAATVRDDVGQDHLAVAILTAVEETRQLEQVPQRLVEPSPPD